MREKYHTEEHKRKISSSLKEKYKNGFRGSKGYKFTEEQKLRKSLAAKEGNVGKWMKGRKMPKEVIDKRTKTIKEKFKKNPEIKEIMRQRVLGSKNPFYGKTHTEEVRKKISKSRKGKHPKTEFKKGLIPWNYIDGRSKLVPPGRYGDDWDKIRLLVYLRDRFTCQDCRITMNEYGRALDIHHKIPFLISFDNSLNNLVTLCKPCHNKNEAKIMRELKNRRVEV